MEPKNEHDAVLRLVSKVRGFKISGSGVRENICRLWQALSEAELKRAVAHAYESVHGSQTESSEAGHGGPSGSLFESINALIARIVSNDASHRMDENDLEVLQSTFGGFLYSQSLLGNLSVDAQVAAASMMKVVLVERSTRQLA